MPDGEQCLDRALGRTMPLVCKKHSYEPRQLMWWYLQSEQILLVNPQAERFRFSFHQIDLCHELMDMWEHIISREER